MKTKEAWTAAVIRIAERNLGVPPGWWGTWHDVHGSDGLRVKYNGLGWTLSRNGTLISRHDSRAFAIKKATKMARGMA